MADYSAEEKISPFQLFSIIFLVPYGSAILFFLTPEAKQNAWIALLIYIVPALLLQHIYITLYSHYPEDTLITYLPKIFGKFIGTLVSIIYILYFTYIAARVLRDFSDLILISTLTQTPLLVITFFLTITITFGVSKGLENLCRGISTFFPGLMIFLVVIMILFFTTSNIVHLRNMYPILEGGMLDLIKQSWRLITFPYGETIIFTMVYFNINKPKKIRKAVFAAVISQGIVLAMLTIIFIVGLGVNFAERELFPLLDALRLIRLTGFLDRLDLLIIIVLVVNGFIKVSFFMYVAMMGTSQLFKMKNKNALAWPFGAIVLITSILIARSFPQHLKIGFDFTPKYIHIPLQILIPVLALGVHYMRNGFKKAQSQDCKR